MNIDRTLLKASWQSWISNDNRERAGPWWLQWVWTVVFAGVIALPFTVLGFAAFASGHGAWRNLDGWIYWYGKNFIVTLTISVLIHLMFDVLRAAWARPQRIKGWRDWQRSLFFGGVPLAGVLLGWPLGAYLAGMDFGAWVNQRGGSNVIASSVMVALLTSLLLHFWFSAKARGIEAERRATESQLRLLQAQIEPHFLFNTLANVQSLMDHDLPKAKQMLSSFTDYLRASLTTLRGESSSLDHELQLAQSYLQLLQARMEDRLQFSIQADAAARAQALPPLLLQPLVENAVVHGLEPSIAGGTVRVTARVQGAQLLIEVFDDGQGLDAPSRRSSKPGSGVALSNIRQRLSARYGGAATLSVTPANPGTLARITLPLMAA
jgi:signal transduction histidine kinase